MNLPYQPDFSNDVAVVTGAGIMGLLHVKVAKMRGLRVIITEVDEARKAMAKQLGADLVVDPTKESLKALDGRFVLLWGSSAVRINLSVSRQST